MIKIQTTMAMRAIELLELPKDRKCHVLDIGCGSGLSGEALSECGHSWTGIDISPSMLGVALNREVEGDLMCHDMGQGLPFRPGMFDGCISISVLQWLCNADQTSHVPQRRLLAFFKSLQKCLVRGARAIFQFYPESAAQMEMITKAAITSGFGGGLVTDFPDSKRARKLYLCLFAGLRQEEMKMPKALEHVEEEEQEGVIFSMGKKVPKKKGDRRKGKNRKDSFKSRDWIQQKKERRRAQGKDSARDSKFTGRTRKPKF